MATEWLGLNEIAGSANFTFVAFIGYVLLTVIGLRFGVYAYWNGRASDVDAQLPMWGYMLLIGLAGALSGLFGIMRIVLLVFGGPLLDLAVGFVLVMVLCLTLALRSISVLSGTQQTEGTDPGNSQVLVLALVGGVAVAILGTVVFGERRLPFAGLQGVLGTVILVYGYLIGAAQLSRSRVQGTLLDTLLRHLLPVLVLGAMIPILELAVVAGLDRAIVLHVQIVLVIMTATTLMTATIKLRQNLQGMRA